MEEMDINKRILALCEDRGWTIYRLAKESGITYSTLFTMLRKGNTPSLPTLFKLCEGFGITLAQFFDPADHRASLTESEKAHLQLWNQLSEENRRTAGQYVQYLLDTQR